MPASPSMDLTTDTGCHRCRNSGPLIRSRKDRTLLERAAALRGGDESGHRVGGGEAPCHASVGLHVNKQSQICHRSSDISRHCNGITPSFGLLSYRQKRLEQAEALFRQSPFPLVAVVSVPLLPKRSSFPGSFPYPPNPLSADFDVQLFAVRGLDLR